MKSYRTYIPIGILLLVSASISACSPENIERTRSHNTETNIAEQPTQPGENPEYYKASFRCYDSSLPGNVHFYSLEEVWEHPHDFGSTSCNVRISGDIPTENQQAALGVAPGQFEDWTESKRLEVLYQSCSMTTPFHRPGTIHNEGQLNSARGVMALCPHHPAAREMNEAIELGTVAVQQSSENKVIPGDGRYIVGLDVSPGIYITDDSRIENCYWEISDPEGNIVQNNLVNIATSITVTLTDGNGFTTEGCGRWAYSN